MTRAAYRIHLFRVPRFLLLHFKPKSRYVLFLKLLHTILKYLLVAVLRFSVVREFHLALIMG